MCVCLCFLDDDGHTRAPGTSMSSVWMTVSVLSAHVCTWCRPGPGARAGLSLTHCAQHSTLGRPGWCRGGRSRLSPRGALHGTHVPVLRSPPAPRCPGSAAVPALPERGLCLVFRVSTFLGTPRPGLAGAGPMFNFLRNLHGGCTSYISPRPPQCTRPPSRALASTGGFLSR